MKFNMYTMKGVSEEDNKVLNDYLDRDLEDEMEVDEYGRVFDANRCYIADIVIVDAGEGIGC